MVLVLGAPHADVDATRAYEAEACCQAPKSACESQALVQRSGVALFIWVAGLIPDALSRFTTDSTSIVEDIATTSAPPRTGPSHRATWSHLSVSQLMALAVCLPAEWVLQLAQHHSVWMWFLYSVLSTSNITSIGVAIVSTAWPEPSASSSSDRSLSISLLR